MTALLHTPLHDWHAAHGGRMVDFAGWSMPVQYGSIVAEHTPRARPPACSTSRTWAGFGFDGTGAAEAFLDRLLTRKVVGMGPGKIRYSLGLQRNGGILDDVLVYHLQEHARRRTTTCWSSTPATATKIVDWLQSHRQAGDEVRLHRPHDRNGHDRRARARGHCGSCEPLVECRYWRRLAYYTGTETNDLPAQAAIVSRTGYTGEDGCELIVPADSGRRRLGSKYAARGNGTGCAWPPGSVPRHAAARSGDAAVRPRADRADRSRSRPAWRSP